MTFTVRAPPEPATSTFCGLISRWMIPASCAAVTRRHVAESAAGVVRGSDPRRHVAENAAGVDRKRPDLFTRACSVRGNVRAAARVQRVALAKLSRLHRTMAKLVPQIRYWLKTGYVAANKIISLQIPELYAIVRGKVGKTVEFGLNWGITRLRGGFLLATLAGDNESFTIPSSRCARWRTTSRGSGKRQERTATTGAAGAKRT